MKYIKVFLIYFFVFLLASCSNKPQVKLICDMTASNVSEFKYQKIYLLDLNTNKAFDVSTTDSIEGQLFIEDNRYKIFFPNLGDTLQGIVYINRISGKIFFEFGHPPFDVLNYKNVHDFGVCISSRPKKL